MKIILVLLVIFIMLVLNEIWWRQKGQHSELSRKFIHLTVGSFVASWPFYLSRLEIELLSLAFILVILISKRLHIFKSIHSVQRPTWGEVYFAISVGLIALITSNKWVYLAAILQLGLADGLAAIIGVRYGAKYKYLVFRRVKSLAGSAAFWITSLLILIVVSIYGHLNVSAGQIIAISLIAAVLENIGVDGLDNLLVPLFVAIALLK